MVPFAANFDEVLQFIVIVVIVGFSIVSKIVNAAQEAKAKANRPKPRKRQPPIPGRPPAAGGGNPPASRPSIESEIEKFLRQAREGGGQQRPAAPQPPPPPRPVKPVGGSIAPGGEAIQPGRGFGGGVESHVQQHMGTDRIADRDAHLAGRIESADERIEQHLEDVFDHDVGRLQHEDINVGISEGTDAAAFEQGEFEHAAFGNAAFEQADFKHGESGKSAVESTPAAIRKMLQSPDDIRKVFIISEILKRPEF